MTITKITTRNHPDQIITRELLDTMKVKARVWRVIAKLKDGRGLLIDVYG